jgi:peroxiredoxin
MRAATTWLVMLTLIHSAPPATANAAPESFTELNVGDAAPDFDLPGVDGKSYKLADFADAKLLLVIFTCNHCPTAQAYEQRIIQLHKDYKDRGLALVAISPNDDQALRLDELGYTDLGDSFEDMKLRAEERGFQFPYLYDGDTQHVAAAYGVVATPQVFLFDQERKLRYVGRIDDSEVKTVKSHDARNAIEAVLAGKPVPVESTRTFGCSTKWSEKRADAVASLEKWNEESVEFTSLDEGALAILAKNETDQLLVVNVWATWCGPCVKELPEFVTINRMYRQRRFRLVTISLDEPEQREDALAVLQKHHVSCANYFPAFADRDRLADLLDKEWKGPLPHTVLIAPGGKVIYRQSEEIKPLELRREIVKVLGRTYGSDPEK